MDTLLQGPSRNTGTIPGKHFFPARLVTVYAFFGSFLLLVLEREILRLIRSLMFHFGRGVSRVLIIGNSEATRDIALNLSHTAESGYKIVAVAGPAKVVPHSLDILHFKEVESALREIKSMRTVMQHRRKGVAAALLQHILLEAKRRNYRRISLETGSVPAFFPAHNLYKRYGFTECGPFADYSEDPFSIFMTKEL